MPGSWITDLRHFLDDAGLPVGGPPGRRAAYWCQLIEAATVRPGGAWGGSAVRCRRSPRRVRCRGYVRVRRSDATETVEWECATCGDRCVISGWAETAWDLRWAAASRTGPLIEVRLSHDEYAHLRGCEAIGVETPVLLATATVDDAAVVLAGTEAELDDVLGHVAAEANHTLDRRRRVALAAVYARVEDALAGRGAPRAVLPDTAPHDTIVQGIADALGLTPAMRERYADVLGRAANDTILELGFRRRIEALLDGAPVPTGRQLRLALELGELVDRIRATGAARLEVACAAAGHLLGRLRAAADTLSDTPALHAACTQLGETAVALARRTRPDRSRLVLAPLLDAYLDDHLGHLDDVPAALRRARFGKRLRRWLAAEMAARSDTADPARAARCAAITAVVVDGA